jgi:hypothetical protein
MQSPVFHHPALVVRHCEFGWGVFTTANLSEDTIVEQSPYLILPDTACDGNILADYVFRLSDDESSPDYQRRAMVLGWGSLYNHNKAPNLSYGIIVKRKLFQYITSRQVYAGEQLFVSYGEKWWADRTGR